MVSWDPTMLYLLYLQVQTYKIKFSGNHVICYICIAEGLTKKMAEMKFIDKFSWPKYLSK